MRWIKPILQGLFPGQLATLLQIIGIFAMIILYGVVRAKFWQDRGGSAAFLTKQKITTLFGASTDADDTTWKARTSNNDGS